MIKTNEFTLPEIICASCIIILFGACLIAPPVLYIIGVDFLVSVVISVSVLVVIFLAEQFI